MIGDEPPIPHSQDQEVRYPSKKYRVYSKKSLVVPMESKVNQLRRALMVSPRNKYCRVYCRHSVSSTPTIKLSIIFSRISSSRRMKIVVQWVTMRYPSRVRSLCHPNWRRWRENNRKSNNLNSSTRMKLETNWCCIRMVRIHTARYSSSTHQSPTMGMVRYPTQNKMGRCSNRNLSVRIHSTIKMNVFIFE